MTKEEVLDLIRATNTPAAARAVIESRSEWDPGVADDPEIRDVMESIVMQSKAPV